ncbi:hypothetical protein ABZN20_18470 [Methylococcus sp. ANG]|uniref:hypothetical protein n=1 Tax=Methylococcus sp. ANG TaxID=3231903 RepID=UPI00345B22F4
MANNSKVKLSTAVRKARRKPAEGADTTPAVAPASGSMEAPVTAAPAGRAGVVPAIGRACRLTVYGAVYGMTYTVVFPWALVR